MGGRKIGRLQGVAAIVKRLDLMRLALMTVKRGRVLAVFIHAELLYAVPWPKVLIYC